MCDSYSTEVAGSLSCRLAFLYARMYSALWIWCAVDRVVRASKFAPMCTHFYEVAIVVADQCGFAFAFVYLYLYRNLYLYNLQCTHFYEVAIAGADQYGISTGPAFPADDMSQ